MSRLARERHLLDQPAAAVVRHLARQRLEEAQGAALRLNGSDPEALHDFRVALRRLRTLLRAYGSYLPMTKKAKRRLRDLARATNEARDLEVAVANLRPFVKVAPVTVTFRKSLARRHEEVQAETVAEVMEQWPRLSARLRRALEAEWDETSPHFGTAAIGLLSAEWEQLQQLLASLHVQWQDETAHRARIAGKRLRYLFEPLVAEVPQAKKAIDCLKIFQDRFGLYHDLWVLLGLVASHAAALAAVATHARLSGAETSPVPLEEYAELSRAIRDQRSRMTEALQAEYLAPPPGPFAAVEHAIEALAGP